MGLIMGNSFGACLVGAAELVVGLTPKLAESGDRFAENIPAITTKEISSSHCD
jgi:hypothetical protein